MRRLLSIVGTLGLTAAALVAVPTPAAAAVPHQFAVVDTYGSLVRGAGAVSASGSGYGTYEVMFDRDVSACSYVATIGDPGQGAVPYPGLVFTASSTLSKKGVYVETKNPGGGLTPYPFHLQVLCNDEGTWAVTDYSGGLVRGNNVSSIVHLGPGRYEVKFTVKTAGCAYIATIGDPGASLVYTPGIITVATGTVVTPTGVYVETRDFSGKPFDRPFHIQVQCPWPSNDSWVVADASGTFIKGMNIGAVVHVGTGQYEVYTYRDLSKCSYVATIGSPGTAPVKGTPLVFTATGHTTVDAVWVETKDLSGTFKDLPFHLQISSNC